MRSDGAIRPVAATVRCAMNNWCRRSSALRRREYPNSGGKMLNLLKRRVAYALLALAITTSALGASLLHAWDTPHFAGAAPGYRYLALGYQRAAGANYATYFSSELSALIAQLPAHWHVGIEVHSDFAIGPQARNHLPQLMIGLVYGDYLQALHPRPLAGRLITLRDQRSGAPIIVLEQGLAQRWFGSPAAAIGRVVYDSHGLALHVVGVLPAAFTGTEGVFSSHSVQAWVPGPLMLLLSNGSWPTENGKLPKGDLMNYEPVQVLGLAPLLSVPAGVGAPQLRSELARAFASLGDRRPADARGFVWTTPYSLFPPAFSLIARRIRLFLVLSIAALVLAAVNVLMLRWLGYLRRRNVLHLMRVLGARRGWLLRRLLWRGLATALALLLGTALLLVLGVLLLRRLAGMLGPVLTVHALLAPLAWILPIVVLLVTLVGLLPLLVLLGRGRLDGARTVSGTRGDRVFGVALLAAEVLLGTVMSVLAAWAIGYAWHSAHERLGVLDRPATYVDIKTAANVFRAVAYPDLHAAQVRLQGALGAATAVVPARRALGFGPQIAPGIGSGMPQAMSAGTRVIDACVHSVTPGWVEAVGIRVLAGTNFNAVHAVPNTVLVDARVAERLFGSVRAAIGRKLTVGNGSEPLRVVGVTAPVYLTGSRKSGCPVVFQDLRVLPFTLLGKPHSLAIAGDLTGAQRRALLRRLNAVFAREHAQLVATDIYSISALRDRLAAQQITQSRVFTAIGLLAWGIALSGIFDLLRLYLAQRRRLLAIESALGATPSRTYLSVVLGTLVVAGMGAIIALLLLPWLATQYALLSGAQVAPFGVTTWIALAVLLLAVFLVAHFPARRAARAEPAESLHEL